MTETFIKHCEDLYKALDDRATDRELQSGTKARIFAGSYMEVWNTLGISRTYYSKVRKALERHGALNVLQRGGREADTVIELIGLPTEWDIEGWNDERLTKPSQSAMLEAEVKELKLQLGGINVPNVLVEIDKRFQRLEQHLGITVTNQEKPKKTTRKRTTKET